MVDNMDDIFDIEETKNKTSNLIKFVELAARNIRDVLKNSECVPQKSKSNKSGQQRRARRIKDSKGIRPRCCLRSSKVQRNVYSKVSPETTYANFQWFDVFRTDSNENFSNCMHNLCSNVKPWSNLNMQKYPQEYNTIPKQSSMSQSASACLDYYSINSETVRYGLKITQKDRIENLKIAAENQAVDLLLKSTNNSMITFRDFFGEDEPSWAPYHEPIKECLRASIYR